MEKIVEMNGIKRGLYGEREEKLFKEVYKQVKHLEEYITNFNICTVLSSLKEANVEFKNQFKVEFDTETYEIKKIETTFSNQAVDKNFIELANKLYELKEIKREKEIKVLYKEPGKPCEVRKIENALEAKQELLGGYIEVIPYDDLLLICNEEGKLKNLEPNLFFEFDYIAGPCLLVGDDFENGEFKSLTDEEIEKYKEILNKHNFMNKGEF